jgi:hypothetical protein
MVLFCELKPEGIGKGGCPRRDQRRRAAQIFPNVDLLGQAMSKLMEDVKEGRYKVTEYALADTSGNKAVECVPESLTGAHERKNVESIEDLNVLTTFSSDEANEVAKEKSRRSIQ